MIEKGSKKVRVIQKDFGTTGIQLNLSLLHMYHLAELRAEVRNALKETKPENAHHRRVLEETEKVLDFIVRDFTYPHDPKLWENEDKPASNES